MQQITLSNLKAGMKVEMVDDHHYCFLSFKAANNGTVVFMVNDTANFTIYVATRTGFFTSLNLTNSDKVTHWNVPPEAVEIYYDNIIK